MSPEDRVKEHRANVPRKYKKLYDRVMSKKAPPREAIKLQCLECWAYVKSETELCDNFACPLYLYRPYRSPPSP